MKQWIILGLVFCLMAAGKAGALNGEVKEKGIAGYWNFDEGKGNEAKDLSGKENNGAIAGEPEWIKGAKGSALKFDGVNDYVDCGTNEIFNFGKSDFTIEFRAKLINDGQFHPIIGKGEPQSLPTNIGYEIVNDDRDVAWAAGITICISDGTNRRIITIPNDRYGDDKWHHFIVSTAYKDKTVVYIDGEEKGGSNVEFTENIGNDHSLCIGRRSAASSFFSGSIDEVCLYNYLRTNKPVANALNSLKGSPPSKAIDGDIKDGSAWEGAGVPDWLEINLPQEEELVRVIIYAGCLQYASNPSTECSPKKIILQGLQDGKWLNLSGEIEIPPYSKVSFENPENYTAIDLKPVLLKSFRIYITELQDKGERVAGKSAPPAERCAYIREVKWMSSKDVAEEKKYLAYLKKTVEKEIQDWKKKLSIEQRSGGIASKDVGQARKFWAYVKASAAKAMQDWKRRFAIATRSDGLARALGEMYGDSLEKVEREVSELKVGLNSESISRINQHWGKLKETLSPWEPALKQNKGFILKDWIGPQAYGLMVQIDPGKRSYSYYPVSIPLNLELMQKIWGVELDPYEIRVAAVNPRTGKLIPFDSKSEGEDMYRCPSRFDRSEPKKGILKWIMKDNSSANFLITLRPKPALPPETGMLTVGDGDRLYYARSIKSSLPGCPTSAAIVDWDGDGLKDLITGAWTDYAHFWKNTGSAEEMKFSEMEHWFIRDEEGQPILACPEHPGIGFSYIIPIDVNNDGLEDLFVYRLFGSQIVFYRNLGPKTFPVMAKGRSPQGLGGGLPAFGDLDGDGKIDALSAERKGNESVLVFKKGRLDAEGNPAFDKGVELAINGQPFVLKSTLAPHYFTLCLADLDDDGDLDLTYYVQEGYVYYSENTGTPNKFCFAEPCKVEGGSKPLDIGSYYNAVNWCDADGNGVLDLICTTGVRIFKNVGDKKKFKLNDAPVSPQVVSQEIVGPHRLQGFCFVDWDKDGDLDRVMTKYTDMDLEVEIYEKGYFRTNFVVSVDANKDDWYGCPDNTEYSSLYSNLNLVDIDNDGDLDLFVTSEHGWRYGYIHYYENLGNGKFAVEKEFRPGGTCDYVKFVPGKVGQGIEVDNNTMLDYLTYPTKDNFDPSGGTIKLWFKPNWDGKDKAPHYLFYTEKNPSLSLDRRSLYYFYIKKEGLEIYPGFALLKTEQGNLALQLWHKKIETPPLDWEQGKWYQIEASWGAKGASIIVNGQKLAEAAEPVKAGKVGGRIYLGSRSVMFVQHEREYPERRAQHPLEWIYPAKGVFDEFAIQGPQGEKLLALSFEGNCDGQDGESGDRLRIGYRCRPDFADLNGDGLIDMVMMVGDGYRGEEVPDSVSTLGRGLLYLFPNIGTKTEPKFGKGILLKKTDGQPFRCFNRTQITCVDWDKDGKIDVFLSTENTTMKAEDISNQALDYFHNEGTKTDPVFGNRVRMQKVIDKIQPWHETKIAAVDINGDGMPDVVASADNGSFYFSHSYLTEEPPPAWFSGIVKKE